MAKKKVVGEKLLWIHLFLCRLQRLQESLSNPNVVRMCMGVCKFPVNLFLNYHNKKTWSQTVKNLVGSSGVKVS